MKTAKKFQSRYQNHTKYAKGPRLLIKMLPTNQKEDEKKPSQFCIGSARQKISGDN